MLIFAAFVLSSAEAALPAARWISPMDYPAALNGSAKGGTVEFTLTYNDEGRVTGCAVTKSAGDPLLDATACRLSRSRGRALPGTPREQSFSHDWKPLR